MEKNAISQSPKLSVTPAADQLLSESLEKVNAGFLGGKVSKLDLASWAIISALEDFSEAKIEKIRKPYFNELTYLESLVKLSKQNGQGQLRQDQLLELQALFGQKMKSKTAKKEDSDDLANVK